MSAEELPDQQGDAEDSAASAEAESRFDNEEGDAVEERLGDETAVEPNGDEDQLVAEDADASIKKIRKVSKRPTSKWVLFLSENRAQCSRDNPDLSFADITKLLAEQYKIISPEETERLENLVKEQKAEWVAYQQEVGRTITSTEAELDSGPMLHFPLARIKKLIKLDPEVKNLSKDALVAVTKTSELFLARLALKASAFTSMRGGKTVQLDDLLQAIHTHEMFDFLVDDFPKRVKGSKKGLQDTSAPAPASVFASSEGYAADAPKTKGPIETFFLPRETGSKHSRENQG